jgi:DNA-binding PucR family transcriptional regulator
MHYDEDNGTSYFRTLVIYSACRMNMKRCSEILNIHRSTLQYLLDKIVELSGNESLFADPFHLELSVRIIYSLDPDTFKKYEIPTEPFAPALLT